MNRKLLFVTIIVVITLSVTVVIFWNFFNKKPTEKKSPSPTVSVISFEDCLAAGYPVQESYPRKCSANGKSFTEDIGNSLEKQDLIQLITPVSNLLVTSPLKITGQARGKWFFEASFPVKILDANSKVLGQALATTTDDWMTDNFVPFTATLIFLTSTTSKGTLVLEKENPSGLPQNADHLEIPIKFK